MDEKKPTEPLTVTILLVFVLFITSWNGIRVYSAIANWQVLREFGANPVYILATGLFWIVTSLWLAYAPCQHKKNLCIYRAAIFTGLYLGWYWFDRLVVQPAPAPNTQFSIVVSLLSAAFIAILLSLPVTRAAYYKKE